MYKKIKSHKLSHFTFIYKKSLNPEDKTQMNLTKDNLEMTKA